MHNLAYPANNLSSDDVNVGTLKETANFFRKNGHNSPNDPSHCPFQLRFNTKDTLFEHMYQDPLLARACGNFFKTQSQGRKRWIDPDCYPVKARLADGFREADADGVMLVDIGGGTGRDVVGFKTEFPNVPGKVVLQDLPGAVRGVQLPGLEVMGHDFFQPQPVKGWSAPVLLRKPVGS